MFSLITSTKIKALLKAKIVLFIYKFKVEGEEGEAKGEFIYLHSESISEANNLLFV